MDIILVSSQDNDKLNISKYDNVIVFEKIYDEIINSLSEKYYEYYDYYYLKKAIEKAKRPTTTTLLSGSSYCLYGIETNMLSNEVNLGLPSQDLYYSLRGIYQICR